MKNRHFLLVALLVFNVSVIAQNKIGDNPTVIQAGSLLELESQTKGLRLPRIELNDVHAWTLDGTAVSGMLISNETGTAPKGIYYWSPDSVQWVRVVNSAEFKTLVASNTIVLNNSSGNTLTTTVNGVTGQGVNIVNSNSLNINNGQLTSTVNGVESSPAVGVLTSSDNGMVATNGNVQLGGVLTKPTTLSASVANTLAITGLQEGDVATDSLLVAMPNDGVLKKVSSKTLGVNESKTIELATEGQKVFATPLVITDLKKIQVFRNGISVEFTKVDDTHIELEPQSTCYANDEIKIIQLL
ncbi:MAG TPA: hypothetical protein VK152_13195 [Paludibacter sp.]|nr:hypothetical protein [Paludibacter sp.]